jgi:hypothetical protein
MGFERLALLTRRRGLGRVVTVLLLALPVLACRTRQVECEGPHCEEVERVIPLIERATGLEFREPPRVEERTPAQVREFVLAQLREPRAVRELVGMELAYKRFGLLPDTLQLREFLTQLLQEQIIGYYDPATKVLYVVEGADRALANVTLTHELVHALQDQHVDLRSFQTMEGQNDRQMAAQAVFEGQAVFEQLTVMLGGGTVAVTLPGSWERVRAQIRENQASMPIFSAAPLIIQETLIFPYLSGAEFVRSFKTRRPGESPLDDLPLSTSQILHPAKYFGTRVNPLRVQLAVRGSQIVYENTLGEFETRVLLYEHTRDQNDAVRGAAGWAGDRYAMVRGPGGDALVWVTVWDTPYDAGEFRDLMQRGVERRFEVGGTGEAVARTWNPRGRTVHISTVEIAGRPAVIYIDGPPGISPAIVDTSAIRLDEITQ